MPITPSGMRRLAAQLGQDENEISDIPTDQPKNIPSDTTSTDDGGALASFTEDPPDVTSTDDGGAIVKTGDDPAEMGDNFYENLAEKLDISTLSTLGLELIEQIDRDKEARKSRDAKYAEGIKRTGLGDEAPGGAAFPGASTTVHPMLSKGCIDFASRAIREVVQPTGVVKDFIPGTPTKIRLEKAKRLSAYMNWQLKTQMPEFRNELEQLLTQLPLGGSQYLFLIYDATKKRPVPTFWPIDDVYLPYAASNFYTADRVTMVEKITQMEYDRRVAAGVYRKVPSGSVSQTNSIDQSQAEKATDKVEGKKQDSINEDGLRPIYRTFVYVELEDAQTIEGMEPPEEGEPDGDENEEGKKLAPYMIEIDANSHEILSVIRNWENGDDALQPMNWLIDFTFIPWRGAVGVGLTHLIGSLAGTATGAIRALLDSAHINNLPTLIKLKGSGAAGQTINLQAAGVTEIDGGTNPDDIRKLIMAMPFNPPSMVLLQLLGFVTQEADSVVRTTFEKLTESGRPDMPVGTTLALIEQGMKVIAAIYLRLYDSMTRVIQVLYRINRMYLDDATIKKQLGEMIVYKQDFEGPLDVIPVADPEIFSDAQRFAQIQMVAGRADTHPDLYDRRKVEALILQRTKLPNAEELLIPAPTPEEMNAVNENVAMSLGRPVAAFPEQDHLGHIQVLMDFAQSQALGQLPIIAPTFMPAAVQHIREHIVMQYASLAANTLEKETGQKLEDLMKERDTETRAELDRTLAAMSPDLVKQMTDTLTKAMPMIAQMQQMAQQFAPQTPQDPRIASAQMKAQSDAQKLQAQQQQTSVTEAGDTQRAQLKAQTDLQRTREEITAKQQMNTDDNLTALTIAQAEVSSGEKVALSTGTGINPGD